MERLFERIAGAVSAWTGRSAAFALAATIILVWGMTGPLFAFSDTWQLVINTGTTIVTFLMVFLIQNAQNRDASALQAKLDEVIRANRSARNEFIGVEHLTQTELEKLKRVLEQECGDEATHHESISRLLARL